MGAAEFAEVHWNPNPQVAFDTLVDNARFEFGHDPYSGTIAAVDGWKKAQSNPVTLSEAEKIMDAELNRGEKARVRKWGPALAVPLVQQGQEQYHTETITLSGDDCDTFFDNPSSIIPRKITVPEGHTFTGIASHETVDSKARVTTAATEGKRETRYFVTGRDSHWEDGHKTQAQARAAAAEALSSTKHGNASVEVYAVTRRADGSALATATRRITSVTVRVTYVTRPKPNSNKIAGWFFFGLAPA